MEMKKLIEFPLYNKKYGTIGREKFQSFEEQEAYVKVAKTPNTEEPGKRYYEMRLFHGFMLQLHKDGLEFREGMADMLITHKEASGGVTENIRYDYHKCAVIAGKIQPEENEEAQKEAATEHSEAEEQDTDNQEAAAAEEQDKIAEETEAQKVLPPKGLIAEIPLSQLEEFPHHPFLVQDDEDMKELAEDIKQNGVLVPALVRRKDNGKYQIISGHRRKRACELAGLETLKCEIAELADDEAVIAMINSNLIQRKKYKLSEKAFAYKMKLEAMKRQGQRENSTSSQVETKLRTDEEIAKDGGESRATVQRYIRLTYLIPELLSMADENKIAFNPAVEISYLKDDEQKALLEVMKDKGIAPSLKQADKLKQLSQEGTLTEGKIEDIIKGEKVINPKKSYTLSSRIMKLLPETVKGKREVEELIFEALQSYLRKEKETDNG